MIVAASARRIRCQKLAVSAPFHCPLMRPAAEGLREVLATIRFQSPAIPVVTSVEARAVASADELPRLLERQVTAPVRWEETARVLAAMGPTLAVEVGPGRTLTGLMKRIAPELPCVAAGDAAGVEKAREALA